MAARPLTPTHSLHDTIQGLAAEKSLALVDTNYRRHVDKPRSLSLTLLEFRLDDTRRLNYETTVPPDSYLDQWITAANQRELDDTIRVMIDRRAADGWLKQRGTDWACDSVYQQSDHGRPGRWEVTLMVRHPNDGLTGDTLILPSMADDYASSRGSSAF